MNIGTWDDVIRLEKCVHLEGLRAVIKNAEIGMFTPRPWHFWRYWLGLAEVGTVPPLPTRKLRLGMDYGNEPVSDWSKNSGGAVEVNLIPGCG